MKRLLYIFFLFLSFAAHGQMIINSYQSFPAAGGGSPTLPTSGLLAYFEGTTGATTSQWSDQSGNNKHLTQATTGNKPSYTSPVYTFNNTAPQYMSKTSGTGISGAYTMYFVVRFSNSAGNAYVYGDNGLVSGLAHHFFTLGGGSVTITSDANTTNLSATAPASNTWSLVRCYYNGASSEIRVDNNTTVTGTSGTQSFGGAWYLGFDVSIGGDAFDIKGWYIYNGKPNDAAVKSYTTSKWGLP